jgi:DNA-binding beta-propeller fold protein YncE
MKRIALISLLALAAALPGAAPAAYCSPLTCAASGASIGNDLLAARPSGVSGVAQIVDLRDGSVKWRLPSGILVGHTLVEQSASNEVTWHDALTGQRIGKAKVAAAPAGSWYLTGLSQDGTRAVLMQRPSTGTPTVVVVSQSKEQRIVLPAGNWDFDALSGDSLYLLKYLGSGYEVRLYDLAAGTLAAKPLKDPKGSSTIWGQAWERVGSPDGRFLFTLYIGSDGGAMVHQLNLKTATARCIDLPGSGSFNASSTWAMELSPNGKTLWAVSPGLGRVAGIDVGTRKVRVSFRFKRTSFPATNGPATSVSAISSNGSRMAVGTGGKIFYVSLAARKVVEGSPHGAVAIGYAPDGTTLWVFDNTEHVTALPAL